MSRRLVLTAGVSFLLTVAPAFGGTPFGGDDGGFVPPNAPAKRCEETVLHQAQNLVHSVVKCHVKAADQALKGSAFDEEGCEQGGLDHFGAHILSLVNQGGCAPCTGPMSSVAAVGTTGFADTINGNIYCAPGVPFGGDDGGNVPPDKATGKCEDQLAKHVAGFLNCIRNCHVKAARRAFRGDVFEDETCEQGCRAKPLTSGVCPPCLDAIALNNIATQAEQFADNSLGSIYCASPGGAFLGEGS